MLSISWNQERCLGSAIMSTFTDLLDQFENELTCSICNEIFRDPRTLTCLHSFCSTCIESWCKTEKKEKRLPTCPHCRTIIQLPEESVKNLRPSFYFSALLKLLPTMRSKSNEKQPRLQCVSCEKQLTVVAFCFQCNGVICEECVKAHGMLKQVCEHHEITMLNEFKRESVEHYLKNQGICREKYHESEKLKFYCEDCKASICQKCAILDHKDHVKSSIEEAAERAEQLLENELEQLKQLKGRYEEELEFSKRNMERMTRNVENTKTEVRRHVKLLIDDIKDQETAMIKHLDELQREQKADNQKEMDDIETGLKRLFEFQVYSQTICNRKVACEILESQKGLLQRSQMLKEQPSVLSQQPIKRNMTVEYVTNQVVMHSFGEIGKIVDSVTDPSQYTINLESLQETRCGFVNQFEIFTPNSATHDMISITIKDSKDNEVKNMSCIEDMKLLVSFNVEITGAYRITVTIGGQDICNSPQTITAWPSDQEFHPIKIFGKQGKVKGALRMPWSLALSDAGNIAVIDCDNNCVVLFDIDGNFVRHFGNKLLSRPCGITFCQERIIVSDQLDDVGRIQEFDMNGKKQKLLYKAEGFFPRGMCLVDNNTIAVCCDVSGNQNPGIKIFSQEGQLIQEFKSGTQHDIPVFITYGNGKYFVTYFLKSHISVFNKNGQFLGKFCDKDELSYVCGLSVCGPDMIVVCNCVEHCIQLFTQEGKYVGSFGSKGTGIGEMVNPQDVVVSAKGIMYVLECGGRRLQVWR